MPAAANSAPIEPHALHQGGTTSIGAARISEGDPLAGLERETGFEPATLSLGTRAKKPAVCGSGWQTSENRAVGERGPNDRSPTLGEFRMCEAPVEPHDVTHDLPTAVTGASEAGPRRREFLSDAVAWLTVAEVARQLRVSSATVYRLVDRGQLRHARVSNAIRISRLDLAGYLGGAPERR